MVTRKVGEPVQDALKAYLELALGLTDASRKKAEKTVKKLAKELVGKGEATAGQLHGMAEDLMATSTANREAVARLVRVETDRALNRVGLATADDVASLVSRIDALERQLHDQQAGAVQAGSPRQTVARKAAVAKKAPVARKAAVAKKAPVAKKPPTVATAAKKAGQSQVPVATPRKTTTAAAKRPARKAGPAPEATS